MEDKDNYSSYAYPQLLNYILKTGLKVEDKPWKLRNELMGMLFFKMIIIAAS